MRGYIINLTNHLISKNRYDDSFHRLADSKKFVEHVKMDLLIGDVEDMSPEKLGQIMCSLDIGDVMASRQEIFDNVTFNGDCEDLLRELVSFCLASAICSRLDSVASPEIPRFERRVSEGYQIGMRSFAGL